MRYCVLKGTVTVIDGSENLDDMMMQNAVNAGFTVDQVEILNYADFKLRDDSIPKPVVPKTELELLKAQVTESQGALDFIVMNF